MRPTQSGTAEPTRWRDTKAKACTWIDGPNQKVSNINSGLIWFGSVYVVTTTGFVAHQLM